MIWHLVLATYLFHFLFFTGILPHHASKADVYLPKPWIMTSQTLTGMASWYGHPFHGRTTANGERYDMYKMTAAHKTLKLGTYLEIVNLSNHKKVIVKVNDRGPYVSKRILDLSYAAARELGFVDNGLAKVQARILKSPPTS